MTAPRAAELGQTGRPLTRLPVCGWSPAPSDPTIPLCNRAAAAHIKPLDGDDLARWSLFACREHAPFALVNAGDAHPVTDACWHRASIWVEGGAFHASGCAMPRQTTTIGTR